MSWQTLNLVFVFFSPRQLDESLSDRTCSTHFSFLQSSRAAVRKVSSHIKRFSPDDPSFERAIAIFTEVVRFYPVQQKNITSHEASSFRNLKNPFCPFPEQETNKKIQTNLTNWRGPDHRNKFVEMFCTFFMNFVVGGGSNTERILRHWCLLL